jgi:serine/threonine-protein phosphatase PGAM5
MRLLIACLLSLASFAALAADAPGARTIVLVRHGHYAPDPAADPKLGPGLSPLGVAQARRAGERLASWPAGFDARYVSPLQRARDSADAIAPQLPTGRFEVLPDLEECTPPTRRADIMAGEAAEALEACRAQLERIFAARFTPSANGERTELMVCHGNVIRYLVTRALGVDPTAWLGLSVGHASITRIRIEADGSMKVLSVGDVGHIPATLQSGATGDAEAAAVAAAANSK